MNLRHLADQLRALSVAVDHAHEAAEDLQEVGRKTKALLTLKTGARLSKLKRDLDGVRSRKAGSEE